MKKSAYFFVVAIGTIMALFYGQALIIQFILAYLLWFATTQLKKTVNKSKFVKKFIPQKLQTIIILAFILFVASVLINALINNSTVLIQSINKYQDNIALITKQIEDLINIDLVSEVTTLLENLNITNIISQFAGILSSLLSSSMMIFIFLLFIFLETDSFTSKIKALFPDDLKREKFLKTFDKIENSVSRYFKVKTLVSFVTAVLGFIVFSITGLDSPLFWSFLLFLLNFIPTIGSIIATIFPALFSLLQFASFTPAIIILISVLAIQQIVGNFIEPKLMGKTLNISPIITIISLTLWGQIWGIIGMLLSIPITVTAIIVLSQFESTKKIAIILSEKGKITSNE